MTTFPTENRSDVEGDHIHSASLGPYLTDQRGGLEGKRPSWNKGPNYWLKEKVVRTWWRRSTRNSTGRPSDAQAATRLFGKPNGRVRYAQRCPVAFYKRKALFHRFTNHDR